jgi:hypothetical protein
MFRPITVLKTIPPKAIFGHFNATQLLHLSSDRMNEHDNRDFVFKKSIEIKDMQFRPTIENIIRWLEELGVKHVRGN